MEYEFLLQNFIPVKHTSFNSSEYLCEKQNTTHFVKLKNTRSIFSLAPGKEIKWDIVDKITG